jgi:hypothetical protein
MPSPETRFITPDTTGSIASIISQIQYQPESLVLVLGQYDSVLDPAIKALCNRAIVPSAASCNAAIIDNGENSACAALLGEAARDHEGESTLIGIAAHDSVPEPNHSTIVRLSA